MLVLGYRPCFARVKATYLWTDRQTLGVGIRGRAGVDISVSVRVQALLRSCEGHVSVDR